MQTTLHSLETDVHFSMPNHCEHCIQGLYAQWCHLYDMLMCGFILTALSSNSQIALIRPKSDQSTFDSVFFICTQALFVLFCSLHWQFWQAKINIPRIYSGRKHDQITTSHNTIIKKPIWTKGCGKMKCVHKSKFMLWFFFSAVVVIIIF